MSVKDMTDGMGKLGPEDTKIAAAHLIGVGRPGMIWGPPGCGKSDAVAQVARDRGSPLYDIRLPLLDPTDMRGIPFYNPQSGVAEWAPSSIFPKTAPEGYDVVEDKGKDHTIIRPKLVRRGEGDDDIALDIPEDILRRILSDKNAVVFLDEINAAPTIVQAAAYQLVLNRRIGEYELPEGAGVLAAGNDMNDGGVTFKMPTPLLNRFVHLNFGTNYDDWHAWAMQNGLASEVMGYLDFSRDKLFQFDPKKAPVEKGFPTPRSWQFVSDVLAGDVPERIMQHLVAGCVGQGAAIPFMAFKKRCQVLPNPFKVLDGSITEMPGKVDMSNYYVMVNALSQALKHVADKDGVKGKETLGSAARYMEFLDGNFEKEFCVVGMRDCFRNLQIGEALLNAKNWKTFAGKYKNLVLQA